MIMASVEFQVSRKMIEWIASNEGITSDDLANALAVKKKDKFLNGIINKTIAEELTKIGKIPFGYLFLNVPPKIQRPKIPDLRTTVNSVPLSDNFFDVLNDVTKKIEWYKDYLLEEGYDEKLSFVNKYKFTKDLSFAKVAKDISNTIGFNIYDNKKITKESYFNKISSLAEDLGILVFKNGIVKSNTHKKLDANEFRGFALVDNIVPAVFVNNSDALSAQIFTLLHEIAHIWIGKSGVSDWGDDDKVETFCNKVSAEILMPTNLFQTEWKKLNYLEDIHKINELSSIFKVSSYASAIKAFQLNFVPKRVLSQIKENLYKNKSKKSGGGGNLYNNIPTRNSKRLTNVIVSSAMSQKILLREAASLLNVKPHVITELYSQKIRTQY